MNEPRLSVLSIIVKKLDNLAEFTNNEIGNIKIKLSLLLKDIKQIKDNSNTDEKEALREIIETERLKLVSKRPEKFMRVFGWIIAVIVGIITILYAIEKIFK